MGVQSSLITQIQRRTTSHKTRSLAHEGYKLKPSGLCCFEIVKPDGSAYLFRPLENSCSCPAPLHCFHKRQFLQLLAAELLQGTSHAIRLLENWCNAVSVNEHLLDDLQAYAGES